MAYHFDAALLRKIKESDFLQYFRTIIPDAQLEQHGNYYTARCPHPDHEDAHPSFRIWHNADKSWTWCCMACHNGPKDLMAKPGHRNYGTDLIAFVQWMSDYTNSPHILTFEEAVLRILEFYKMPMPTAKTIALTQQELYNQKMTALYHRFFLLEDSEPKQYFLKRKFSMQDAETFQIGTDGDRLIFPLFDAQERIKGFITRTVRNEEPKYKHSSARDGFIKSEYLYGIHRLDRSIHTAYITEGVFDVISATRYGIKNVVACLGTSFMESHALLLKEMGIQHLIFIFDGDDAGQKALYNAIKNARKQGLAISLIRLPIQDDLDSFCQKYMFYTAEQLQLLEQTDYEYELRDMARDYKKACNALQDKYLLPILKKAETIQQNEEYLLFRNYVLNHFNIVLEPRENYVRKVKTNLAHSVSAQTKTTTETTSKTTA